jgi:transporter family protein
MNPLIFAFLGAIAASAGTIFAKFGLKGVDSNLLTALRGILMAIIVTIIAFSVSKISFSSLHSLSTKNWIFLILSALGGALSWLLFYYALAHGNVVGVTVIDKLSIVITALLAVILLSEKLSLASGVGLALIVIGSILVAVPVEKILSLFK